MWAVKIVIKQVRLSLHTSFLCYLFIQGNHFSYITGINMGPVLLERTDHNTGNSLLFANSVWLLLRPTEL